MKSRKYIKDYKLIETVLPNGGIKTTAQYSGEDYFFISKDGDIKKARSICTAFLPACWILFIAALLPLSRASHLMYVILPFIASSFPLLFLSESIWCLLSSHSDKPLTRQMADKISQGLPIGSLLVCLFCSASFLGLAITAILTPEVMLLGDLIFGFASLILAVYAGAVFRHRKIAATFKAEKSSQTLPEA